MNAKIFLDSSLASMPIWCFPVVRSTILWNATVISTRILMAAQKYIDHIVAYAISRPVQFAHFTDAINISRWETRCIGIGPNKQKLFVEALISRMILAMWPRFHHFFLLFFWFVYYFLSHRLNTCFYSCLFANRQDQIKKYSTFYWCAIINGISFDRYSNDRARSFEMTRK